MKFDYDKFKQEIYLDYKEDFSKEDIDSLLDLEDGYESRDTPISTGKRLLITGVYFKGIKTNGDIIDFSQEMKSGVNIWIADNLKGKSSLFKIIQFALTGDNKLKHDVKKWISSILVSFRINDKCYSIHLELSRQLSAQLYGKDFNSLQDVENTDITPTFVANSIDGYERQIEDFFFKQFSYYSLKWTQKASQKDVNELYDARATWKTYFKSIFLESRDSAQLMFGDQGKKIFQMLLGLELTYPINRLTIKKDRLEFDKGNQVSVRRTQIDQEIKKTYALQTKLIEINHDLDKYNSLRNERLNIQNLYSEYDSITNTINSENARELLFQDQLHQKENELYSTNSKKEATITEKIRIQREYQKNIKLRTDLQEYLEIGVFFSNLDIKHCPNCNHDVAGPSKDSEKDSKECLLCHEPILESNNVNTEVYQERMISLQLAEEKYKQELSILQNAIQGFQTKYDLLLADIENLKSQMISAPDLTYHRNKLHELEALINREKEKALPDEKQKDALVAQKAVTEFQLQQLMNKTDDDTVDSTARKIELLTDVINRLNRKRYEFGKGILQNLSSLMLSEINDLGLNSITDVKISDSFVISYKQDGDYVDFSDIAEGEQLRAKIAFYLSLIQLDIDHNFGRHTRFLIIDSPSKEEGDAKYLDGFIGVLKVIESRFGDQLQILIGTAERELSNSVSKQIIRPEGQFLF